MSTKIVPDLYYTDDDEWIRVDGSEATIGITDHAQDSLSDIVFLELPGVGASFGKGDTFGVVESVKAAADLMMPVGGEITAVNEDLARHAGSGQRRTVWILAGQDHASAIPPNWKS